MEKKYEYEYEGNDVIGVIANGHTYQFYYDDEELRFYEDYKPIEYFDEDHNSWISNKQEDTIPYQNRLTLKEAMRIADHILPKKLMGLGLYLNEHIPSRFISKQLEDNIDGNNMFFTRRSVQKYLDKIVKLDNGRILGIFTSKDCFKLDTNNKNKVSTDGYIFIIFENNMALVIRYKQTNIIEVEYKKIGEYEINDFLKANSNGDIYIEFRSSLLYDSINKKTQKGFNYSFIKNIEVKGFKSSYIFDDYDFVWDKLRQRKYEKIGTIENFDEICINLDNGVSISIGLSEDTGNTDVRVDKK